MDLDGVPMVKGLICLSTPLPCRYCKLPSYLAEADEERRLHPFHPCCQFWIGQEGRATCVACANFNSRRTGRAGGAQTPAPSSSGPTAQVRPLPQKSFDEDEALLLVLAELRRTGKWVEANRLLPTLDGRADLLALLVQVGVERDGNFYRIPK